MGLLGGQCPIHSGRVRHPGRLRCFFVCKCVSNYQSYEVFKIAQITTNICIQRNTAIGQAGPPWSTRPPSARMPHPARMYHIGLPRAPDPMSDLRSPIHYRVGHPVMGGGRLGCRVVYPGGMAVGWAGIPHPARLDRTLAPGSDMHCHVRSITKHKETNIKNNSSIVKQ